MFNNKEQHLRDKMKEANIPGISIAAFDTNGKTSEMLIGVDSGANRLTENSIFRAASLSKPVFAYLVLKLIADNKSGNAKSELGKFKLPNDVKEFDLDTKLYKVFPEILKKFKAAEDIDKAKNLTARFVLSHQTGLPINQREEILKFQFEPGQEYGYSNPGIGILQETIEKLTGSNLQTLAKANVFEPLGMHDSTFDYELALMSEKRRDPGKIYLKASKKGLEFEIGNPPWHSTIPWKNLPKDFPKNTSDILQSKEQYLPILLKHIANTGTPLPPMKIAANSLHTTAKDYCIFMADWMSNKELFNQAITSQASIENDKWATGQNLSGAERKKIAWGLGVGLQKTSDGQVTHAFHSGDMDEWRAFVAVDTTKKKGIVYFSNSRNGLVLLDDIFSPPNIEVNDALKYVFQKYGFARKIEDDWQKKEIDRVCKIITRYELNLADLQNKKLVTMANDKHSATFTVNAVPDYSLVTRAISSEFDEFKALHGMKENSYKIAVKSDQEGNILSLEINIYDNQLYNNFIENLKTKNLLTPSLTSTQAVIMNKLGASRTQKNENEVQTMPELSKKSHAPQKNIHPTPVNDKKTSSSSEEDLDREESYKKKSFR